MHAHACLHACMHAPACAGRGMRGACMHAELHLTALGSTTHALLRTPPPSSAALTHRLPASMALCCAAQRAPRSACAWRS